jgi:hypothetical protein
VQYTYRKYYDTVPDIAILLFRAAKYVEDADWPIAEGRTYPIVQ